MATFKQGILGGFSGKVGTVIGSFWKGRNVMRSVPQHVHNPKTAAQEAARSKFSLLSNFLTANRALVDVGFKNFAATITQVNAAISVNYDNGAVSGTYPALSIDYDKVLLSKGTLLNPADCSVAQGTGQTADITWTDNTGTSPELLASDVVMVCLYNQSKNSSTASLNAAVRDDEQLNMAYPAIWSGDTVIAFLATRNTSGELMSTSIKIGTFVAS